MKKIYLVVICMFSLLAAKAQVYTNQYPKELVKIANKWVKSGVWKNGFTKATPSNEVNLVEFYLQYNKNPEEWKAMFKWIQDNDLKNMTPGKHPIEGTNLVASVEDGDNWCSEDDLKAGKGSESHYQKIDFMYVVDGTEGFARLDHQTSTPKADYKIDRLEYNFDASKLQRFNSHEGHFNIMFPCDWHIAKVKTGLPSEHLKVVVIKMTNKM